MHHPAYICSVIKQTDACKGTLLFPFLLSFYPLFGQEEVNTASLIWGEGSRSSLTPERFVGYDAKGNLVFFGAKEVGGALLGGGATGTEACLIVYNKKLEYKDNVEIEIPDLSVGGKEYYTLKNIGNVLPVAFGDTSYIIGTAPADAALKFYAWRIDPIRKKLVEPRVIGEIKGIAKLRTGVEWNLSPNQKMGLLSVNLEQKDGLKEYIHCIVVDQSMQQKAQIKAVVPYTSKEFTYVDISLDDQGKVLLSGKVAIDKDERKDKNLKTEPVLLSFSQDSKPLKRNLQVSNKKIQNLKTSFGKDGKGIAIGFYGNDRFDEQDGLFFSTLDSTGELSNPELHEFDTDFLVSTLSGSRKEKTKQRIENSDRDASETNFVMREIKNTEDGGFLAIAENYRVVITYNQDRGFYSGGVFIPGRGTTTTTVTYVYGDLLVARFESNGQMAWVKKLARSSSANTEGIPYARKYASIVKGNTLFLFYEDYTSSKPYKNIDVLTTITKDGKIQEDQITDEKTSGAIQFGREYQSSNHEVIMVRNKGIGGRKKYIGVLKIE